MTRTLIRNVSQQNQTLPLPYTGVLRGGESTVVADTPEAVIAYLGGWENVRSVWAVDVVSEGNPLGPYQRSTAAQNVADALSQLLVALSVNGQRIINLGAPSAGSDAATKQYVDSQVGGGAITPLSGSVQPPAGAGPFTAGTPVGVSTSTGAIVACDALIPSTFPCIGLWTADDFIRIGGVEPLAGFTPGALLYVAEGGGLTATPPATKGAVQQQVASALAGGTTVFVVPGGLQMVNG